MTSPAKAQRGQAQVSQRGQSMVELAMLLPILLLILLGIIDLGRVFNAYIVITNAAREGVRYGSLYPSDTSGIRARVIAEAQGSGIPLSSGNIQVSAETTPGDSKTVTVTFPFSAVSTLISTFWGGGDLQLQSRAVMVIQ